MHILDKMNHGSRAVLQMMSSLFANDGFRKEYSSADLWTQRSIDHLSAIGQQMVRSVSGGVGHSDGLSKA